MALAARPELTVDSIANAVPGANWIEREIHVTDEKIDALIYELYGLTDEEIRIVEESM